MAALLAVRSSIAPLAVVRPMNQRQIVRSQPLALPNGLSGSRLAGRKQAPVVRRSVIAMAKPAESIDTEELQKQAEDFLKDIQEKWDKIENKTSVGLYAGGALVALWFSSTIVGAVNSVPLLPKLLELVGLGYTSWFVYRYLLFKTSRKELLADIEEIKGKITGAKEEF